MVALTNDTFHICVQYYIDNFIILTDYVAIFDGRVFTMKNQSCRLIRLVAMSSQYDIVSHR